MRLGSGIFLKTESLICEYYKYVFLFLLSLAELQIVTHNLVVFKDDDPGTTYHDLAQMAAVTIRHGSDGKIQMVGSSS